MRPDEDQEKEIKKIVEFCYTRTSLRKSTVCYMGPLRGITKVSQKAERTTVGKHLCVVSMGRTGEAGHVGFILANLNKLVDGLWSIRSIPGCLLALGKLGWVYSGPECECSTRGLAGSINLMGYTRK